MKNALTLLLFVAFGSLTMSAQTVDEIIDTYIENIGGADAWSKVEGVKMFASVNQGGMDIPLEIYNLVGGKQYMKFNLQGKDIVQLAFDGETAWGVNFMTGAAEPKTSEEVENMKREMGNFPDPFLNYKEKGYTAELMGKETAEGVECFKIKLTKKPLLVNGVETPNEAYYFFDPDNYVPIMREQEIKQGEMKGQITQEVMSNYDEVDGLYFAFSSENKIKGTEQTQMIAFSKIELNPTVDDKMFEMPVVEEVKEPAGEK